MQSSKLQFKNQKYADFYEERKLWRRGVRVVVGLDEAGRGPLAGPVCAAAVCAAAPLNSAIGNIRDSKKLTPKQREKWYEILTSHPDIRWGIGIVSEKIIDQINIFEATKLAMKKAVTDLSRRIGKREYRISRDREIYDREQKEVDFLILDGNFTIDDLVINQKAIIRGDEKVFSCAAASIIAKVTRDRLMVRLAKRYPEYGFEKHKGYGTQFHRVTLKKHGPCQIHRKSFKPMSLLPK
jgi:ribonuclease HII